MKSKILFILIISFLFLNETFSQSYNQVILNELKTDISKTDSDSNKLITNTGFNVFMQRKAMNYLTGISDLSLAKFYSSYSTDNDRLNFGFNIPFSNPYTQRLAFIFNPILEADVKNSFSTLYKDGKWKNNIRGGFKLTYLLPFSTMNFWSNSSKMSRKKDLKILRTNKFNEIDKKMTEEFTTKNTKVTLLDGSTEVPTSNPVTDKAIQKKRNESFEIVGIAEADYLEKERAFTWMQTGWFSAWTMFPITEAEKYISIDNSQPFQSTKFKQWEINFQFTYLLESSKIGSFFISPWLKHFQNNSANADLMTNVDYNKYSQFPGSNPINLALLETNQAYIGSYKEFMTTNFNLQFVYITPLQNTLLKPGFSFRYEKNWGDFSPTNLRFGLPFSIQGKEKPINIEIQYRINDIGNYKSVADHKPTETVGLSLGFPFALFYK